MNNQDAIAIFARHIGLHDLALDATDQCDIEIDGNLPISLNGAPGETVLEATARLMPLVAAGDIATVLLELNFAGASPDGGWFAVDQSSAEIVLRCQFDLNAVKDDRLIAMLEGFAKAAHHWQQNLPKLRQTPGNSLSDFAEENLIRL